MPTMLPLFEQVVIFMRLLALFIFFSPLVRTAHVFAWNTVVHDPNDMAILHTEVDSYTLVPALPSVNDPTRRYRLQGVMLNSPSFQS